MTWSCSFKTAKECKTETNHAQATARRTGLPASVRAGWRTLHGTRSALPTSALPARRSPCRKRLDRLCQPAGMAAGGNQMSAGLQALYGRHSGVRRPGFLQQTASAFSIIGWLPGSSAFYNHSLSNRSEGRHRPLRQLRPGHGFWQARAVAAWSITRLAMMAMTLQPTVAYRINGAGRSVPG